MSKKLVKNISEVDQTVAGIGVVKIGEIVEVSSDFHNANFENVKSKSEEKRINEIKKETKKDE